jgi:hypothetical protein
MRTTIEALIAVDAATAPSDLFGRTATDPAAHRAARRAFHRLSVLIHPDRVDPAHTGRAAAAFTRATDLYRRWQRDAGTAAADNAPTLTGRVGSYTLGARHARGSIADLHRATDATGATVMAKIPRSAASSSLLDAERDALTDIADSAADGNDWLLPYFPRFVDQIEHADPAGARRHLNVLDDLSGGFVTLADVAAAYPGGLDPRDWAWMHRRLLRALAAAHRAGWAHTAVTADNVLIHPEHHGVVLAGWSFATRPGAVPAATISSQRVHYPPEAADHSPATAGWDVYMAHQLMLTMLGDRTPPRMHAYAAGCMQAQPTRRPDAADLLDEFDDLLDQLYGRRQFRPFTIPATKGP